jgi:hypothetical protein
MAASCLLTALIVLLLVFFAFFPCHADGFNFLLTPKQGFQLLAADRALSDWLGGICWGGGYLSIDAVKHELGVFGHVHVVR